MRLRATTMRTRPTKTALVPMQTKAMTAKATASKTWTETVFVIHSRSQVVKTKQRATTLRTLQMMTVLANMRKLVMIAKATV